MMTHTKIVRLSGFIVLAAMLTITGCTGKKDEKNMIPEEIPTQNVEVYEEYSGENGKTITNAAQSKNTVNGYYADSSESKYILENMNSRLVYNLSKGDSGHRVESLTNSQGGVYVSDTMETYAISSDGVKYSSEGSAGRANLFNEGYYYYELHVFDQSFTPYNPVCEQEYGIEVDKPAGANMATTPKKQQDGSYQYTVTNMLDPYICYNLSEPLDTKLYDTVRITIKTTNATTGTIYYVAGSQNDFNGEQKADFQITNDGEYHTYYVAIGTGNDYKGKLKAIRLDAGAVTGEVVSIKDLAVVQLAGEYPKVKIDRCYCVYPDKVNEYVRLVVTEKTASVQEYGTITRIDADTVSAIVVKDASGTHDTLDSVDWNTAEYAGFDIKDAGIFGYILENDSQSGTMTVSLEDGQYVIYQKRTVAPEELTKKGECYMPRRIYTDETHSFETFLYEAECERNPMAGISVVTDKPVYYKFLGYDVLTGSYIFKLKGLTGGFDEAYEHPFVEHKIGISIQGEASDRKIYVRGYTIDGALECAVVLDKDNMLLPINVECCKNFAHDGEELFYTDDDSDSYGISVFPLVCEAEQETNVTLCHLYEGWGNYRLKQISSIRYFMAYYHLSLGVTETNCINFYNDSRLPDHRGLSARYWTDEKLDVLDASGNKTGKTTIYGSQPQHGNVGSHYFFSYSPSGTVDFVNSENIGRTVISDSGPTASDITLEYLSDDGLVYQTYRHVEMPQTDENRAYYEIDYEFLGDVSVDDFKNDVILYSVTNDRTMFGYLDENNTPQITQANKGGTSYYVLGSDCPYCDYFKKADSNPNIYTEDDVYCNTSFIVVSGDIVIGGKKWEGNFLAIEGDSTTKLTLNISGKVSFKKGDHIKLYIILLPWGNYDSENDNNVRNVRINTCLNPIGISDTDGEKYDDQIVPTVVSSNKTTCEFTISGGYDNTKEDKCYSDEGNTSYKVYFTRENNITVKVKGFEKLGVPVIYENVEGQWVRYEIASSLGYDGYAVSYEADGTFTYSFVVTMSEGKPRTFKVEVQ